MIREVTQSLRILHNLGYSHGDLKPENICAKQLKDSEFQFTVMNMLMSKKLVKLGAKSTGAGSWNVFFASVHSFFNQSLTQLDDLFSLLFVAYYFIEGSLPWIDFIAQNSKGQTQNFDSRENFIAIRIERNKKFQAEINENCPELVTLFELLEKGMDKLKTNHLRMLKKG